MTIVVDSSALVAILKAEDDSGEFVDALGVASARLMSAANYVECGMVSAGRLGPTGLEDLRTLISHAEIEIVPIGRDDADTALQAHLRFGRGRHPAKLNFGDCFAYALAKSRNMPLLFKGDDFIHTDIEPALKPA